MGFDDYKHKSNRYVWSIRNWKITYDDTWREIMREVAEITGFPYEDIERVNSAWWKYVGEMLRRPEMPIVRIVYLCRFAASAKRLYRYCETMEFMFERLANGSSLKGGRGIKDLVKVDRHLKKLHDTYMRRIEEAKEFKRRQITWKFGRISKNNLL